jgi:hypothetical protein
MVPRWEDGIKARNRRFFLGHAVANFSQYVFLVSHSSSHHACGNSTSLLIRFALTLIAAVNNTNE